MDYDVPSDHRVKLKENEKKDKYLDFGKELEKKTMEHEHDNDIICNWWAWYSHQKVGKGLEDLEIRSRMETILTTTLLRSARIPRRVLETWDLLSLKLQWETISQRWRARLSNE